MVIIFANLLDIMSNLQMLYPENSDNYRLNCQLGLSNLLLWISVNGYYLYYRDYDKVPITIITSAKVVIEGIVGILPMCIGVAIMLTCLFYQMHQYRTPWASLFTMFYLYQGDTQFDTIYAQN